MAVKVIKAKKAPAAAGRKNEVLKVKTQAESRTKKSASRISPQDLEHRIRERAYFNYLNRGCTSGCQHQDWLEAERQVKKELGLI